MQNFLFESPSAKQYKNSLRYRVWHTHTHTFWSIWLCPRNIHPAAMQDQDRFISLFQNALQKFGACSQKNIVHPGVFHTYSLVEKKVAAVATGGVSTSIFSLKFTYRDILGGGFSILFHSCLPWGNAHYFLFICQIFVAEQPPTSKNSNLGMFGSSVGFSNTQRQLVAFTLKCIWVHTYIYIYLYIL